ncbi:E3 ubiquitin-protein ligase TRIM39-like isoform X2 [Rhinatrema bivittatum]|uniref:E3 ubiquitin-protein ligase TRIM39-like isoform X2 n=1 Tax=Rhinatrema bivittatum TaxID=194408 RepID=UPI0011283D61|nr:E3 ubiquitin-protein ligase TRIM39-like isoform X2 [Rhinatrema bivittatum]
MESLWEEASCSICLDYFIDPVTIDCGHNFCRSCITRAWEGLDTNFPCPKCRETSQQRKLRPNWELRNLIERVKKMSERKGEETLCQKHEEKLKLFCTEDWKAICLICKEGKEHRSHSVVPIEEAVQDYKCETAIKREKILSEFEELHQFLNEEQQIHLSRLEEEEKKIVKKIRDNVSQLEEQSSSLQKLISEIEEKCQQPAVELLKDAKATLSRCQAVEFPKPEAAPVGEGKCSHLSFLRQYFVLKDVLAKHQGKLSAELADVTLDPETANPWLVLSEDGKSVRQGDTRQNLPDSPQRFDTYVNVLGREGFTSGRHYWEVEVGDKTDWILGVCKDSVSRKGKFTLTPENGFWAVILRDGEYKACTSLWSQLPLSVRPRAVGILLDYQAGKVSFYDADEKSHLFTFTHTFTEKLRPYFYPGLNTGGKNAGALRIRPVPAWE